MSSYRQFVIREAEMGVTSPLNSKSASFSRKTFPKRAKNDVLVSNKVENRLKRAYDEPKRAKTA